MNKVKGVLGYWTMTWLGLFANIVAMPVIGIVAFAGPPLQTANISLAFSIAWPSAIVGVVGCSGLLAERKWGVILSIIALSMALSSSLPYGIVRLVLVKESYQITMISLFIATLNLISLIYWCRPIHRKTRRL